MTGGRGPVIGAVTCLGCGCACDDIAVALDGGRIAEARNACELGAAWFGDGRTPARVLTSGREASLDAALDVAAGFLARAARPLVYLAPELSCEAQREGVGIADLLHAAFDSVTSATTMRSILAAQELGRAGATLGEVRHRADLLVFWGVDPARRYPRFRSRYAAESAQDAAGGGRGPRTIVAVDVGDAIGPPDAHHRLAVAPEQEVATLTALAALLLAKDRPAAPSSVDPPATEAAHPAWRRAADLAPTLAAARYCVVVADGEPDPEAAPRDPARADALLALGHALNAPTRGALSLLRAGGNRSGAEAVATWQTGFPAAVDFTRGYPRYRPHDGSAGARLARGEVDAVLVLGAPGRVPPALLPHLATVPCAAIGPGASESALGPAAVVIDTALAGVHEAGMAIRMDEVPLPLRALLEGPPAAAAVAALLREKIAAARQPAMHVPDAAFRKAGPDGEVKP
jgi:formylmethanofuran dehydrogenase subunit B